MTRFSIGTVSPRTSIIPVVAIPRTRNDICSKAQRFAGAAFRQTTSLLLAVSLSLFLSQALAAQTQFTAPEDTPESAGPKLGELIGAIAENDSREAIDYRQLAELTIQLGQAAMQQGQRIPDESIWDGIHSVDTGQSLDSFQTDWDTLRSELEKLLEKPPEDEQEQQDNQDSEDQNQEDSENQENSESQDPQGDSGDSNSDQNQDQESQEQQQEQQEESDGDSKNEQDPSGDQENQDSGEQGDGSQDQQPQTNQKLGDMEDPEQTPELDQQSPEPQEEQNQIGGTQKEQPIRSAKQAMTLQQLEQIKQQDKPGALHMLLQQAERGENAPPPQTLQKDW